MSKARVRTAALIPMVLVLAAIAAFATRELYNQLEGRQDFARNYAQVVSLALIPIALAAVPAAAYRSERVLVALSVAGALPMAAYTADHFADPLRYDNSVALVRSTLVFVGAMSFALGMLLPLTVAFGLSIMQRDHRPKRT